MIYNSSLTVYHNVGLDLSTGFEKWQRFNYDKVWFFDKESSNISKGYNDANNVEIRIAYEYYDDLDANNFSKGDIVVKGTLDLDIETQQDLKGYKFYNITSISNNDFGINKHIHIGGK